MAADPRILTPDQRLRVFVSSTLRELAPERVAARGAIEALRLTPVLFELGARPHPPQALYRSYLEQSDVFVGIYWESYGWVGPGMDISGIEDEVRLATGLPKLLYVKEPAPDREARLRKLLASFAEEGSSSYQKFASADELRELVARDLAVLMSERFATTESKGAAAHLPAPRTTFVGRTVELARLEALLADGAARLLTITGPGGIGKTRLAIEAARRASGRYPGGVFFVPLEGIDDPALVGPAVATAVGARETGADSLGSLAAFLRRGRLLLVLDNFEQVVAGAPAIAELLERVETLTVLVTSRALLRVRGEHELSVPPLDIDHDAVALLRDRAAAARHGFELDVADVPVVREICARLDALPLAIELAAPRLRVLTPSQLLERLRERLAVAEVHDAPPRQRTLEATIAWSYELLSPSEQCLFEQLAVFPGSFTLEAVEAVCTVTADLDAFELFASLLDKSILQRITQADAMRFSMLAMIRDYAHARLTATGELEATRARHATHFLAFAERHSAEIDHDARRLNEFELEHENFRAALAYFEQADDGEDELRLVAALAFFWHLHGHLVEGRRRLERALRQDRPLAAREQALRLFAAIATQQHDYATAATAVAEAIELAESLGDDAALAASYGTSANIDAYRGDLDGARAKYAKAEAMFQRLGNARGAAVAAENIAYTALIGDDEQALALCEAAAAQAHAAGIADVEAGALLNLALARVRRGDADAAVAAAAGSAEIATRLGLKVVLAYCTGVFGAAAALRDDVLVAVRLLAAAEAARTALGRKLDPFEESIDARARSSARAALDDEAFERAWRDGSALPLEVAVTEALAVGAGVTSVAGGSSSAPT